MSGKDAENLAIALSRWPFPLYRVELHVGPKKDLLTEQQKSAWPILRRSVATLMIFLPEWTKASESERAEILREINEQRHVMTEFLTAAKGEEDAAETEVEATA